MLELLAKKSEKNIERFSNNVQKPDFAAFWVRIGPN